MSTKKFTDYKRMPSGSKVSTSSAWRAYWRGLTEEGRQSIRDKARWEKMSLMAIAIEWGATC
jgi:hypothetical protein